MLDTECIDYDELLAGALNTPTICAGSISYTSGQTAQVTLEFRDAIEQTDKSIKFYEHATKNIRLLLSRINSLMWDVKLLRNEKLKAERAATNYRNQFLELQKAHADIKERYSEARRERHELTDTLTEETRRHQHQEEVHQRQYDQLQDFADLKVQEANRCAAELADNYNRLSKAHRILELENFRLKVLTNQLAMPNISTCCH